MEVLAGDIGGTKALLAVVGLDGSGKAAVVESRRYEVRGHAGLAEVCRAFAADTGRRLPARAGFGVAGPVLRGRVQTTNLPWVIDEQELAAQLGLSRVKLVNDFVALALGLPFLDESGLATLQQAPRDPTGTRALIGAGTGLGECGVVTCSGGVRVALPGEGGHADFAPRDETELGILRFLWRRYPHASWERVLSGDGLVNLVEALAEIDRAPVPPELAQLISASRADAPARVTELARAGEPLCKKALQKFCSLYGAEAGNLALKLLPTGGVYVAGGIAARILPELKDGAFREAFVDKGRMRPVLEAISVVTVLDPLTPLYGAASLAA